MKQRLILSFMVMVIVVFTTFVFSKISIYGNKMSSIKIKGSTFKTEIVESKLKKEKGLGGRKKLCMDCSMLFIFPKHDRWGFWMKGMNFDLDIIWIDGNKIIKIEKNVNKELKDKIYSELPADKVLELNSGTADKKGIEIGDTVEFID